MELEVLVALTIFFELVTVLLRLIFSLRSKKIQGDFGIPRVHHGYIGMALLLISYITPGLSTVFWVVGWALIISDLVHHYTVLPLLRIAEVDIEMQHHGVSEIALLRKAFIAFAGMFVVAILASVATSLWVGVVAMGMIYVSESLKELLPKFKCPQEVANHF